MGSVIIKAGAVVNIGINKQAAPKPYVKSFRDGLHLHAEIDALIGLARKVTKGCTIYTTGFTTKTRSAIMTLACETCKYFCIQMGIRRLVYTTKESEIKELIL
jgi:tRNA(Arg) A34 adenosine deaminase TadA